MDKVVLGIEQLGVIDHQLHVCLELGWFTILLIRCLGCNKVKFKYIAK